MRVLLTPQARGVKSSEVIARIIAGPKGIDVRYVVTSFIAFEPKYLYQTVYCG